MKLRITRTGIIVALAALIGAACSSSSNSSSSSSTLSGATGTTAAAHVGGTVSVWAEWTSKEQASFQSVLQPWETQTGVSVNYAGKGSDMDTALEAAVQGGAPPDVALVPDPGTLKTLAGQNHLKDLTSLVGSATSNFGSAWNDLATVNGKLYGVWFKGANKNTIWYNPAEFTAAGITSPPATWEDLVKDASTLKAAGITPFSLCTDVGWPVADLWQNVYLKTAGADSYNKLATHDIKWTDPSVSTAFTTLGQILKPEFLLGGTTGALAATYPECVDKVFPKPGSQPQAAMIIEADFVTSQITGNSTNYTPGTTGSGGAACTTDPAKTPCYDFFAFPAPSANSSNSGAIQGAGDVALELNSTPQADALIKYLASPDSAAVWAHLGGFASPNKAVPDSAYPDAVAKADAKALQQASSFVFSLDDLQGSWEKQMWADMLNFVRNPTSSSPIQATMDTQASAALGH